MVKRSEEEILSRILYPHIVIRYYNQKFYCFQREIPRIDVKIFDSS